MHTSNLQICPRCHSANLSVKKLKIRLIRQPILQFLSGVPNILAIVTSSSIGAVIITILNLLIIGYGVASAELEGLSDFISGANPLLEILCVFALIGDFVFFSLVWPCYFRAPFAHGQHYKCLDCARDWYKWQTPPVQEYAHIRYTKTHFNQANLIEGVECCNPICNSRNVSSIPYWETLTRAPLYVLVKSKYYRYALNITLTVGTIQFFFSPFDQLLPINLLWVYSLLIALYVGQFWWYVQQGYRMTGRNYNCNACKYAWIVLDPQPQLFSLKMKWYEQELALARQKSNKPCIITHCLNVADLLGGQPGQHERVLALTREATALAIALEHKGQIPVCYNILGYELVMLGRIDEGLVLLEQGIILSKENKNWSNYSAISHSLGLALVQKGDYERAVLLFKESLYFERKREGFRPQFALFGLEGLAEVAIKQEQPARTLKICAAVQALRIANGVVIGGREQEHFDQLVRTAHNQLTIETARRVWQEGEQMPLDATIKYAWEIEIGKALM